MCFNFDFLWLGRVIISDWIFYKKRQGKLGFFLKIVIYKLEKNIFCVKVFIVNKDLFYQFIILCYGSVGLLKGMG